MFLCISSVHQIKLPIVTLYDQKLFFVNLNQYTDSWRFYIVHQVPEKVVTNIC